jgi:hypothetical protein
MNHTEPLGDNKSMLALSTMSQSYALGMVVLGVGITLIVYQVARKIFKNFNYSNSNYRLIMFRITARKTPDFEKPLQPKNEGFNIRKRFFSCFGSKSMPKPSAIEQALVKEVVHLREKLEIDQNKIASFEQFVISHPELIAKCGEAWSEFQTRLVSTFPTTLSKVEGVDHIKKEVSLIDEVTVLKIKLLNCDIIIKNYMKFIESDPKIIAAFEAVLKRRTPLALGDA